MDAGKTQERRAPLFVELDPDLHMRLKLYSVTHRVTMKELAAKAILEYMDRVDPS